MDSKFGELLHKVIFNSTLRDFDFDYKIKDISLQKKKLNELNEFMELYSHEYDLTDIAQLPKELVSIGEVTV